MTTEEALAMAIIVLGCWFVASLAVGAVWIVVSWAWRRGIRKI